jgi:hypothetical protein
MTDVNKARFMADMNRRLGRELSCPLCDTPTLMVGEKVHEVDIHVPLNKRRMDLSEAIAVVPVSCINCGHVMLFNTHMVDCH